ncbi:ankyrin repeat-containing domain-containing LTR copia-type protein [Tanacetum coccineum]
MEEVNNKNVTTSMNKKERSKERREKRHQEISRLRTIPYSDHQRWWSAETVAVVTGANRGIGFEITRQLASHGLTVILTSRDTTLGEEATKALQEQGLKVVFHKLDVVDLESIDSFCAWVRETYGGIDILINNAGISYNTGSDNSVDSAENVINTNYIGTKNMVKAAIPLMRPSAEGARIVLVSSRLGRLNGRRNRIADVTLRQQLEDTESLSESLIDSTMNKFLKQAKDGSWVNGGWPQNNTDYSLSKLAVNAYTRLMAKILAERPEGQRIYINCCCPGWVKTAMTGWAGLTSPEEGADTAVWLALIRDQSISGKFFAERHKLEFTGTHHPFYTRPILEAACQNAHKVVDEILFRSPEAILCTDKSGYDIIQLAVIHRSEKIYNLIHATGERKNLYRTILDFSNNNILHLAGRLAPSYKLNNRRGAALQLQRELQWREEVKKVISPTFKTQENNFNETPDMMFTREHENLVKEGEQWMKTTAESCSITAALITTIVFAAAITVPGGSNSETGIPLFTKNIAFAIFAVSYAISLIASSTALLVFLSILTACFAEEDFLVSLPRRLLIGLCTLLLSAITMMVAFSATLYLVFCHQNPWMLAPICGLSLVPVSFFVALQFPLIVDLYRSTYLRIFGQ